MTNKATQISDNSLYNKISSILEESRKFVATTVNTAMVQTYFEIGRLIVEEEQHGNVRAEYGKETLKNLSIKLTANYGKGFSVTNLKQMRDFYLTYQIRQTVSDQFTLSYSHYLFLMRIENPVCKKKSDSLVEITLPEDNNQIFASKYQTVLPNKEDLIKLIQAED